MLRLKDRVALVFGAGSVGPGWGNGKASAVSYARAGAAVICVDVNLAAAEETVGIIRTEGGKAEALACDVTREDEVRRVVDAVMAALRDHVARDRVYGKDARSTALRTGSAVGRGFTI